MPGNASQILASAWKIIPQFPCSSVAETVKFYTECLHFSFGSTDRDDDLHEQARMCSVAVGNRAAANIYLFQRSTSFEPSAAMIAMGTDELDKYYELLVTEDKVQISMPVENMPWGYRQFEVKDIDGNRLQFFKFLEGGNPGTEDNHEC